MTPGWDQFLADADAHLDELDEALERGDLSAAAAVPFAPPVDMLPAPKPQHRQRLLALLRRNQALQERLVSERGRVAAALVAVDRDATSPSRFVDRTF